MAQRPKSPNYAQARRRLLGTLAPAALGCVLGLAYARTYVLTPELNDPAGIAGMYATLGAVVGILAVRVGALIWMIASDFAGRP